MVFLRIINRKEKRTEILPSLIEHLLNYVMFILEIRLRIIVDLPPLEFKKKMIYDEATNGRDIPE